jgi:hypothetical protein
MPLVTMQHQLLVDKFDRPYVEPSGSWTANQQLRVGHHLSSDDRLLLVTAGQFACQREDSPPLRTYELLDDILAYVSMTSSFSRPCLENGSW